MKTDGYTWVKNPKTSTIAKYWDRIQLKNIIMEKPNMR